MPVRVPQIPNAAPTRINAAPMSGRAAAAPAAALGNVAQAIAGVAQPFEQIAERVQRADNLRVLSATRNDLDERRTQHLIELERVNDPAERLRLTDDFLQQAKGLAENPEHPPAVRDQLVPYFDNWATSTRNQVAANAARLADQRARLALENELTNAMEAGDPVRYGTALAQATEAGVILPEQRDKFQTTYDKRQQEKQTFADIHTDPRAWMEANPQPTDPTELDKWAPLNRMARAKLREEAGDAAEQFDNLMAMDKLTSPEEIDQLFADQSPAVRATMKEALARKNDVATEAQRTSAPYQEALAGDIAELIELYSPTGEQFDADFVEISTRIAELNPGPLKNEFTSQLEAIRTGKTKEIRTAQDSAFKHLDQAFADHKFGAWMSGQSTASAVDAGLLNDPTKLAAAGFTEEQIKKLTKSNLSRTDRTRLFRQLFDKRTEKSTLDPYATAAMQAIVAGETSFDYLDQDKHAAAKKAHGRARTALAEFFAAYPNATEAQITQKLQTLGIEAEADSLRSQYFPTPGVLPALGDELSGYNETTLPPR